MADTSDILDESLLEEFESEWKDTDTTLVDFNEEEFTSDFTQSQPNSNDEAPTQSHLDALQNSFGHSEFRPLQWKIISSIMNKKRDNCAIMATGYGKSLCFQFPAVYMGETALIISPLISLMEDQVLAMKIANIPACLLGSANFTQSETIRDIFEKKFNLVYLTPEFCCGEVGQSILRDMYKKLSITLIAVDEAHCVSSWGHDFRPQFRKLWILKELMPSVPILAVTATATSKVRNDIIKVLKLKDPQVLCSGFDRPNFFYEVHTRKNNVYNDFRPYLLKDGDVFRFSGPTIIYCITRKSTELLSEELNEQLGINCRPYHAGMTIKQRKEVHEMFVKDKIDVVIATIAFGMGIDKPDIRQVIHHGISSSIEAYIQESGRAGRDGLPAKCVVMYKPSDMNTYRHIWKVSKIPHHMMEKKQKSLNIVEEYLQTNECRRQFILAYFEDPSRIALRPRPDCCDNCLNKTPSRTDSFADDGWEVLKDVKNFLNLVKDCPFSGEKGYQNFLMGKSNQRRNFCTHSHLFGSGRTRPVESWDDIVKRLVRLKYLSRKFEQKQYYGYNTLSVTAAGERFLENDIDKLLEKNKDKVPIGVKTQSRKEVKSIAEASVSCTQAFSQVVHDEGNSELLQRLRDRRMEMARSEDCMPYMIASDTILIGLCQKMPCSMDELKACQLEGFSEAKLLKYGEDFVNIIRSYKSMDTPIVKSIQQILLRNPLTSGLNSSARATLMLFNQYEHIKKVAEERSLAESTVFGHLILAMKMGHPIKLAHFGVTEEIRNKIMEIIKKLSTGYSIMAPIKLACPDEITFHHIKPVVTYVEIREHLKKLNIPYEDFEEFPYSNIEMEESKESKQDGDLTQFIEELESHTSDNSNFKDEFPKDEEIDSLIKVSQASPNDETLVLNDETLVLNDEPLVKKMKIDLSALDSPPRSPIPAETQEVVKEKSVAETTDASTSKKDNMNVVTRIVKKKKNQADLPPWLKRK